MLDWLQKLLTKSKPPAPAEPIPPYDRNLFAAALRIKAGDLPKKGCIPGTLPQIGYGLILLSAIRQGDLRMLEYCKVIYAEFGDGIFMNSDRFLGAACLSIRHRHYEALKCLLSFAPDHETPPFGKSEQMILEAKPRILIHAAEQGDKQALELLLDTGLDPNGEGEDVTALMLVCERHPEQEGLIGDMIAKARNIDARNKEGLTAFLYLIKAGKTEALKALRNAGASVHAEDKEKNNAFHLAVKAKNGRLLPELLEWGVDINHRNEGNFSPLETAVKLQHFELAERLVHLGAADLDWALVRLLPAAMRGNAGGDRAYRFLETLLEAGVDIHKVLGEGKSFLSVAEEMRQAEDTGNVQLKQMAEMLCRRPQALRERHFHQAGEAVQLDWSHFETSGQLSRMVRHMMAAGILHEAFEPYYWQGRPGEAWHAFKTLLAGLAPTDADRLDQWVDRSWMQPKLPVTEGFVTRTQGQKLGSIKAR